MRKTFIALCALVLVMVLVVGCGGKGEEMDVAGVYESDLLTLELKENGYYEMTIVFRPEDEPVTHSGEYKVEDETIILGEADDEVGEMLGGLELIIEGNDLVDKAGKRLKKQ